MNTTGLVTTVTDELIEQLEALTCIDEGGAALIHTDQVRCLLSELRRLRAENAELAKDAGRYRHIRANGIPEPAIAMQDSYYGELELVAPERIDTAIDTAMATQ